MIGFLLVLILGTGLVLNNRYPKDLLPSDLPIIANYLNKIPDLTPSLNSHYATTLSFEEQITLLCQVQYLFLKDSTETKRLPLKEELGEQGNAIALNKIFKSIGFETRVVKSLNGKGSFKLNNSTPFLMEVHTHNGWLIVDVDNVWVGLSRNYCPISMQQLHNSKNDIDWLFPPKNKPLPKSHPFK